MNSFGTKFRIQLFGESHGPAVGVVMDGIPVGIPMCADDFLSDLARRKSGAAGTTARTENDVPEILSGIFEGHTTGAPMCVIFSNENTRGDDYSRFRDHPRPSHADFTATVRYSGFNDPRGGGHFSGRMTLALVAAGVVAKKILGPTVGFESDLLEVGLETNPTLFAETIDKARVEGDSLGGVVECRVTGVEAGRGEPFFDSVESVASHLLFSIPGIKGVEFGIGFAGSMLLGSEYNDLIVDAGGRTITNNAGGINGGLTNGNPIVVRVAARPPASISQPQETFNFATGQVERLRIEGRHDVCFALRVPVVVEACMAVALCQF